MQRSEVEIICNHMIGRTIISCEALHGDSTIVIELDNNSIPDLIDPTPDPNRGLQLWANVLEDYHRQMRMYQENVRTILDITRTFLPINRNPEPVRYVFLERFIKK